MDIFDIYESEQMIDLLDDLFDLNGFSESNKKQNDDIIECEYRVVDIEDEESKMIE